MAKQGMKHYYTRRNKNNSVTVPELSGKAKSGKVKANILIAGEHGKVYHGIPQSQISAAFPAIDNDLAVENLNNDYDMTNADMQDL